MSFRDEELLASVIAVLVIFLSVATQGFLTLQNLFDLLTSYAFLGILAAGLLVVLISGGIDISFTATASIAQYITMLLANKYGRIVNIASIAGKEGNPNAAAYSAAKAGVIALTKSLGKELAVHDIAVNAVTPAAAKTKIFDQMSQQHIDYMLSRIPRGRFLKVEEAANMIVWLVSAENSFTTGAVFDLSGGRATY